MTKLWGKLWFRIPACLIAGPIAMATVVILLVVVFGLLTGSSLDDVLDVPLSAQAIVAGASLVAILPPLITAEVRDRHLGQPLPLTIYAGYAAILAAACIAALFVFFEYDVRVKHLEGSLQTGVTLLSVCYLAGIAVSTAIMEPIARRWRKAQMTEKTAVDIF